MKKLISIGLLLLGFVIGVLAILNYRHDGLTSVWWPIEAMLSDKTDAEMIEKRASDRWQALLDMQIERVYRYATPEYRSTYDAIHHANQYAFQVARVDFEVTEVSVAEQDPTRATVKSILWIETEGFVPGQLIRLDERIVDQWRKVNGVWWYVEPN